LWLEPRRTGTLLFYRYCIARTAIAIAIVVVTAIAVVIATVLALVIASAPLHCIHQLSRIGITTHIHSTTGAGTTSPPLAPIVVRALR
jgi:hypothetical protein